MGHLHETEIASKLPYMVPCGFDANASYNLNPPFASLGTAAVGVGRSHVIELYFYSAIS